MQEDQERQTYFQATNWFHSKLYIVHMLSNVCYQRWCPYKIRLKVETNQSYKYIALTLTLCLSDPMLYYSEDNCAWTKINQYQSLLVHGCQRSVPSNWHSENDHNNSGTIGRILGHFQRKYVLLLPVPTTFHILCNVWVEIKSWTLIKIYRFFNEPHSISS